jgi:hypothetical protein
MARSDDPPEYNPEADWESAGGATYDAALFDLQAELPRIPRTAKGQVGTREYKYPPYDKILAKVRPVLNKHRFVWRTRPTLAVINAEIRFVLAYSMTHLPSGEKDAGYWPLTEGPAQREGSDVSFAKRYALGAVLDLEITGEDDDARPSQDHDEQPESRPRGQANGRSQVAREQPGSAPKGLITSIQIRYKELGFKPAERDDMLAASERILGRELTGPNEGRTHNNLSQVEARKLRDTIGGYEDRGDLLAALVEAATP